LPKQFVESNFNEGWNNAVPPLTLTPRSSALFGTRRQAGSKGIAFDGADDGDQSDRRKLPSSSMDDPQDMETILRRGEKETRSK
jgi:hypothetical protein